MPSHRKVTKRPATSYASPSPSPATARRPKVCTASDSAIATQLGINVRSVRRWIAELMDELGVTTRLQLGAALVRADALRSANQSLEPTGNAERPAMAAATDAGQVRTERRATTRAS